MHAPAKQLGADSTIAQLLDRHPATAEVLLRHGMACVGCSMASFETLAEAAREYGVDPAVLLSELGLAYGNRQPSRSAPAARSGRGAPKARRRERKP